MINQDNEEKKIEDISLPEKAPEVIAEPRELRELQEIPTDEAANKKVRQEIEAAHMDDDAKAQAQGQANDLKSVQDEEKIEQLIKLAQTKGVVYAVHVAKKIGDPYILDILHDRLAKEGHYKNFVK